MAGAGGKTEALTSARHICGGAPLRNVRLVLKLPKRTAARAIGLLSLRFFIGERVKERTGSKPLVARTGDETKGREAGEKSSAKIFEVFRRLEERQSRQTRLTERDQFG